MKYVICFLILGSMCSCKLLDDSLGGNSTDPPFEAAPFCAEYSTAKTFDKIGQGTLASPYLLCTAAQFNDIAVSGCNGVITVACDSDFKLMGDIDLKNETITPIGTNINTFTGSFDGNKKVISRFTLNATSDLVGMFAKLDIGAQVKDLNIDFVTLASSTTNIDDFGSLAGRSDSATILSVRVTNLSSNLTGTNMDSVGGLIGDLTGGKFQENHVQGTVINANGAEFGGLAGRAGNLEFDTVSFSGTVEGEQYVGGILGYSTGNLTISRSSASVTVVGENGVGGMVGVFWFSSLYVDDCTVIGSIEVTSGEDGTKLGGVAGEIWGSGLSKVSNCSVAGQIKTSNTNNGSYFGGITGDAKNTIIENVTVTANIESRDYYVGGVVGYMEGTSTITNAQFNASITATECNEVGGIAGHFEDGDIISSHARGDLNCGSDYTWDVGGLVGWLGDASVTNSSYEGSINILSSGGDGDIGGFAGYTYSSVINNSYAMGSMTIGVNSDRLGGFIGYSNNCCANVTSVTNSYSAVSLSIGAGSTKFGALAGEQYTSFILTNNFWDQQIMGLSDLSSDQAGSVATEAEGKTTLQMQTSGTFTGAGWDFTNVWQMGASGYPEHK